MGTNFCNLNFLKGRFSRLKSLKDSLNTKLKNSYGRLTIRNDYKQLSKRFKKFKNNLKRYTLKSGNYGDTNSEINSSFDEQYNDVFKNIDNDFFDDDPADNTLQFDDNLFEPSSNEIILKELNLQGSSKLWIGKDYCNFIIKDFDNLKTPFNDFIDRSKMPRMPWHDVAGCVTGAAARDVARHFIQRWNYTKMKKARNNYDYPLLLPKAYNCFKVPKQLELKCSKCSVQCLRSVSQWSAGVSYTESSIHNAMKHLIQTAKHYIYIENQFFISLNDNNETTRNEISNCIYERIIKAHKNHEKFRVYVFIPLVPGYEGEYGRGSGVALHTITHYNNKSINNLLKRLSDASIDPLNYICFFSLRTWSELNGKLVTELIYVHSKLMIIDDRACIIGSANINDRSLLGNRDSEFALLIQDTELKPGFMNNEHVEVGKFCSTLRQKLFKEFLGDFTNITSTSANIKATKQTAFSNSNVSGRVVNSESVIATKNLTSSSNNSSPFHRLNNEFIDPCNDEFYKHVILKYASQNTKIYEEVSLFWQINCDLAVAYYFVYYSLLRLLM